MIKTKKNKIIATLAVSALVCSTVSLFTLVGSAGDNASLTQTSKFETEGVAWRYEEMVARPTGTFSYGGETKPAEVKVIYPNGKESVGKNDLLSLNTEGEYKVEYSATFGETTVVETSSFVIRKDLFYVSSEASSARYYEYKYSEHATEEYASKRDSVVNSSVDGIYVSLASGDEFQYSRVIDLRGLTQNDNLIKMVIAPESIGIKDVSDFTIKLTDAYDPTNYIEIKNYSRTDTPIVYMAVAASNGQQFTGWQWSNPPSKFVNNSYGAPCRFSMTGPCLVTESTTSLPSNPFDKHNDVKFGINTIADNDFGISIDYENLQVFNNVSRNYTNGMIADLDDPEHFEKLWGGFTTGECFLSIKGGTYLGETFNFMITDIKGIDGTLTGADEARKEEILSFTDRGALNIDTELGGYAENALPQARVGVEYPIFEASANNQYFGKLNATYQVLKGDKIVAKNGEKFIPSEAGAYTLKYTVKDYFNTENTKSFTINAVLETSEISFVLSGLDAIAETPDKETVGVAGKYVKLNNAIELTGGCADGVLDIMTSVRYGDEEIPVENGVFFPMKAGKYIVSVTATDYIGQNLVKEYTVEIEAGDIPVYLEKPVLPKYFISERTYKLPEVTAYDYTDGTGTPVKAKVAYIDGEGTKKAIGTTITPVSNLLKKTLDVVYYTDEINAENDYEGNLVFKDVPIVCVTREEEGNTFVDFSKLFVEDGVTLTTGISSSVIKAEKDGSLGFINALGANGLTMRFQGVVGASKFGQFSITLTDSENGEQSVTFYYINGNDTSYFKVNSLQSTAYKVAQTFVGGDFFAFNFDSVNGVKYDRTNGSYAKVDTYKNGHPFKGFTSGRVYVEFGLEAVYGVSEVELLQLGGQIISSQQKDRVEPGIAIEGEYLGYVAFGGKIRIPKAIITDVVDPYVQGSVTVSAPKDEKGDRKIVKTVDGIYLKDMNVDRDYFVTATQYGTYLIKFTARDFSGNELDFSYLVNVVDEQAPEIAVEEITKSYKIGDTIAVPKATVTDNVDKDLTLTVYVYSASLTMWQLDEGEKSFKVKQAGEYRIVYVAVDSAGNYGIKTLVFTVGEQ